MLVCVMTYSSLPIDYFVLINIVSCLYAVGLGRLCLYLPMLALSLSLSHHLMALLPWLYDLVYSRPQCVYVCVGKLGWNIMECDSKLPNVSLSSLEVAVFYIMYK